MSNFNFSLDTLRMKGITFPGGECHVAFETGRKLPDPFTITARITDSDGIMVLLLITDALRRMGVKSILLNLPYVPYARQDRMCNLGEAHSLKVFANLINSQNYDQVTVFDPHSDVVEALFNNVKVVSNHEFVFNTIRLGWTKDPIVLVAPDAGAYKKIYYLGKFLAEKGYGFDIVTCNKERDTKTGAITNFSVGATDLSGKRCIIVDDICDAGGTFLGLADALRAVNAGSLELIVSHGIFSKGFEALEEKFDKIVFTDSFKNFPQVLGMLNLSSENFKKYKTMQAEVELLMK